MECTLNLFYDYAENFKDLIKKADDLAKKNHFKDELSRVNKIESFDFEDMSIRETECVVSLSRILVDYGFYQTLESFKNACLLLLADYNRTKAKIDTAVEKLKESASRLYNGETEADYLWKAYEVSDPWKLLVELLAKDDEEAMARRRFYSKRIAELANPKNLASAMFLRESNEIALKLSPLRLEASFIANDGILPEILSSNHVTDLY